MTYLVSISLSFQAITKSNWFIWSYELVTSSTSYINGSPELLQVDVSNVFQITSVSVYVSYASKDSEYELLESLVSNLLNRWSSGEVSTISFAGTGNIESALNFAFNSSSDSSYLSLLSNSSSTLLSTSSSIVSILA